MSNTSEKIVEVILLIGIIICFMNVLIKNRIFEINLVINSQIRYKIKIIYK